MGIQPFERMRQMLGDLNLIRRDTSEQLSALDEELKSERLLSESPVVQLIDTLSSLVRLQQQCLAMTPSPGAQPMTMADLAQHANEMERQYRIPLQAEQARQTILLFTRLVCLNGDIANDFTLHQLKAKELLESQIADEELVRRSEVYELAIRMVQQPYDTPISPEMLAQIQHSLGFVPRLALENGWLALPSADTPTIIASDSHSSPGSDVLAATASSENTAQTETVDKPYVLDMNAALQTEASDTAAIANDLHVAADNEAAVSLQENSSPENTRPGSETQTPSFEAGNYPTDSFMDMKHALISLANKEKDGARFSVNKFEMDLRQISGIIRMPAFILSYVYNYGIIAVSRLDVLLPGLPHLMTHPEEAAATLRGVLQKLGNKGYLTEFTLKLANDVDTCYTLSDYGIRSFAKEASRKLIHSKSQMKLMVKVPENDNGRWLTSDHAIATALRLKMLNWAQHQLNQALPQDLTLLLSELTPLPYRGLRDRRTARRFTLIPGILNQADAEQDLATIMKIAGSHNHSETIVVVRSTDEGRYWVHKLSAPDLHAYYFNIEDHPLQIVDREGQNQFSSLFGIETQAALNETAVSLSGVHADDAGPALTSEHPGDHLNEQASELSIEHVGQPSAPVNVSELSSANSDESPADTRSVLAPKDLQLVVETSIAMLSEGRRAESMMLLHAIAGDSAETDVLRDKLAFVLGDPLRTNEDWHTLADTTAILPNDDGNSLNDYMNAALWLRVFFEPDNPNDYRLGNRWRQINRDESSAVLKQLPGIKQLLGYFWSFIERHHVGIKYCASTAVRNQLAVTEALEKSRQQIQETLDTVFPRNVKADINHPKIHQMVVDLYGNNGIMTRMLQEAFDMPLEQLRSISQQFSETDLSDDSILDIQPSDAKLEQYLDRHWAEMKFRSTSDKSDPLTGAFRNRMRSWLHKAVIPLLHGYACRRQSAAIGNAGEIAAETIAKTREKAQELIAKALNQLSRVEGEEAGSHCLKTAILYCRNVLNNSAEPSRRFYEPLLLSGEIELDRHFLPISDEQWLQDMPPIAGYRAWERMLQHCSSRLPSWEEAAEQALRCYDMGQYDLISSRVEPLLSGAGRPSETMVEEIRTQAERRIGKCKETFMTDIESAQNYGQMASNEEMHNYIRLAEAAEKHARQTGNAGFFQRLLEACRRQIIAGSKTRMDAMRSRLEALKSNILQHPDRDRNEIDEEALKQWPILNKIERMLEKRNMTVAEDYIHLADSGQKDTPSIEHSGSDAFSRFMGKYQMLFNSCNAHKGDDLYRMYEQSVRHLLFPNQTNNRNTASADRFVRAWFKPQPHYLTEFMEQLIFDKVANVIKKQEHEYYVYPAARDARLGEHPHPFAAFGTLAARKGVRVLMMAGTRTADSTLDEVGKRGAGEGAATIVLLDYALPLADRRQLAKTIKQRSMPENIVVIDRVMTLFLASYHQLERSNAFLMTALPSSKVQPYIPVGVIPPEMFIGRTEELEKIRNMNGPVFVYGGRQLGKTALLRESKNREHDPENGQFAVFVDLRDKGIDEALQRIGEALVSERVLQQSCSSWEELRVALRSRLSGNERPMRKLILLLDEADAFISDCEHHHYRPLGLLKELKDSFNDQFKFVLAGLRDVVRFNKRRLDGNSVLAHLGHITIRPLQYLEARELLLRPLQYLGFRLEGDGEDIISLILAKTNYFPGLIHFYCQKLIEAIADSYRNGTFNDSSSPPYILDEKHIKSLLGQSEFLVEIERKFSITLQLDLDNHYDILAKAMAHHYHEQGVGKSASASDIIRICQYFDIRKIGKLPEENVQALLEEMVELNILRPETQTSGKYVFNRYSFFQMFGDEEEVFNHLYAYSEEN